MKPLNTYVDHTILKPDSTAAQVLAVCAEAIEHQFASVCILPWHVETAAAALAGTGIPVCTVVGFPLGATCTAIKVAETELAIRQGALEIDMVASITALKSGDTASVVADIKAVVDAF